MPISKSARKALRVSRKKYLFNLEMKKKLREAIKKTTKNNLGEVYSLIDKAAKLNLIHKNKAAHLKSRLSKQTEESRNQRTEKQKTTTPKKKTTKKSKKLHK